MRIKEICKKNGVTIRFVAIKSGIPAPTLSRIINGGNTTTDTLEKIAQALNVPISELFDKPDSNVIKCPNCGTDLELRKKN